MLSDLRYALRQLAKSPGFSAAVVLTLALGIGANTAIFSVVSAFVLRPLPYDQPEQLVTLYEKSPSQGFSQFSVSGPKYLAWRAENQVFQEMGALSVRAGTLAGTGEPTSVTVCEVTPSCMSVFRFRTQLGRLFAGDESQRGKEQAVVLSHRFWLSQTGAREDILGQSIRLDGRQCVVVGVLAPGGLANWEGGDVVFTLLSDSRLSRAPGQHYYQVFGRLKPGISLGLCRSRMETLTAQLNQREPQFGDWAPDVVSFRNDNLSNWPGLQTVLLLQGAVAAVLLLACANTACLLLVRGTGRKREIAIRLALGGSRWQVIRQLLIESLLLSVAGGLLGVLFSHWGMQAAKHWLTAQNITLWTDVRTDGSVLVFSSLVSAATGFLSGILPAWQTTRTDLQSTLKSTAAAASRGRHRSLNTMAVVQVSLSFVLLLSAGLFTRNLLRLRDVSLGYDAHNLLTFDTGLPATRVPGSSPNQFIDSTLDRLRTVHGIRSVAVADTVAEYGAVYDFWVDGKRPDAAGPLNQTQLRRVSPDYFRAMGLSLLRGRAFTSSDRGGSGQLAIINDVLAQRFFPGQDPIGAQVHTGNGPENHYTIVGVSSAERLGGPAGQLAPMVYVPIQQNWSGPAYYPLVFVVRVDRFFLGWEKTIKQEIRSLNPGAIINVRRLETWMEATLISQKLTSFTFAAFALAALLLAALGIYTVVAHIVGQRTSEFGIRMALGAPRREIRRLVLRQGFAIILLGIALGMVGALLSTRILAHFLPGFDPKDPMTLACVSALSFAAALSACWLPARRATRVNPIEALRAD